MAATRWVSFLIWDAAAIIDFNCFVNGHSGKYSYSLTELRGRRCSSKEKGCISNGDLKKRLTIFYHNIMETVEHLTVYVSEGEIFLSISSTNTS